jgi:hypothetical protein
MSSSDKKGSRRYVFGESRRYVFGEREREREREKKEERNKRDREREREIMREKGEALFLLCFPLKSWRGMQMIREESTTDEKQLKRVPKFHL